MSYMQCWHYGRAQGWSIDRSHEFASFVMGYRMAAPWWRKPALESLHKLFKEYVS